MHTVEMRLQRNELSGLMAAMRTWLDERRFEPSSFSFHDSGTGVIVRIDFKVAAEADAFARRFAGRVDEALAAQAAQDLVSGISPHGVVG
jgi:hypothetical protein